MNLIQSLLSSKKFIAMLCGVIGIIALKVFKVAVDPATIAEIVGLVAVYIGAQGISDHGVEAAKIQAVSISAGSDQVTPKATEAVEKMAEDLK